MPTGTNCEQWLDDVKLESADAVYSLYKTALDQEGCGDFQCSNRGKDLYIRPSRSEEWLRIASERGRKEFLDMLEARYCGGEDVQVWYMSKGGSMCKAG